MPIDDTRNLPATFRAPEKDAPPQAPSFKGADGNARSRLIGGNPIELSRTARTRPQDVVAALTAEREDPQANANPLLRGLSNMVANPPEPPSSKFGNLSMTLDSNHSANTPQSMRSLFMSSILPLEQSKLIQPQLASALAFGGIVAGCAVGALALGFGGMLLAFAVEALAFTSGVLVSRANQKQLEEANEKLRFEATHDSLTGLLNRRSIMEGLDEITENARRAELGFAVMMCDVDHFKSINDGYGHQAGDEVLRAVAGRIKECLREGARQGRYGGEEFLVLLPEASSEIARTTAERLRRAIADHPVTTPFGTIPVTISLGVASSDRHGNEPQHLLRVADEALYRAKRSGRNRVELA